MNYMAIFRRNKKEDDPLWHEEDVRRCGGYVYNVSEDFSARHHNRRVTDAILNAFEYKDKKVIDIGCGDGIHTFKIWERGRPEELVGVDPAKEAVRVANERYGRYGINFYDFSIYNMPFPDGYFDIAVVKGVIHHLDRPLDGISEAVRISKKIGMTDPNGYNPVLKIIEKTSSYHRAHKEMSFFPFQHNRWLKKAGARLVRDYYILLVPMFFPEGPARLFARDRKST